MDKTKRKIPHERNSHPGLKKKMNEYLQNNELSAAIRGKNGAPILLGSRGTDI